MRPSSPATPVGGRCRSRRHLSDKAEAPVDADMRFVAKNRQGQSWAMACRSHDGAPSAIDTSSALQRPLQLINQETRSTRYLIGAAG